MILNEQIINKIDIPKKAYYKWMSANAAYEGWKTKRGLRSLMKKFFRTLLLEFNGNIFEVLTVDFEKNFLVLK